MTNKKTPKKKKELYAGPNFQNSPCPSSLPIPDFSTGRPSSVAGSYGSLKKESLKSPISDIPPEFPKKDDLQDEEMFTMEGPFQFIHPSFPIQYNTVPGFSGYGNYNPAGYPPYPTFQPSDTQSSQDLEQMSKNLKNVLGLL